MLALACRLHEPPGHEALAAQLGHRTPAHVEGDPPVFGDLVTVLFLVSGHRANKVEDHLISQRL
eukprot:12325043-Alexandrium_andersonii.AAC.1